MKIAGADPDFHRRDLYEAIQRGDYPEWDFGVQLFTEEQAAEFPFDHLDATKLIPEELVPVQIVGRMVLDRWPDNFFAETEQVAFCPANIVPGIDFSDDPLLQGRLFSYLDTQLLRLGGPNFHQIPVNAPQCPFANQQRDGHMQMGRPKGRVAYEPSSLQDDAPRETPAGYRSLAAVAGEGGKTRVRAQSFADHHSQARLFWRSQSAVEQAHIAHALVFELSKVETPAVRERVVGHLRLIDADLAQRVADGLGLAGLPPAAQAAVETQDLPPSPALRLIGKNKPTLRGRGRWAGVRRGSRAPTSGQASRRSFARSSGSMTRPGSTSTAITMRWWRWKSRISRRFWVTLSRTRPSTAAVVFLSRSMPCGIRLFAKYGSRTMAWAFPKPRGSESSIAAPGSTPASPAPASVLPSCATWWKSTAAP